MMASSNQIRPESGYDRSAAAVVALGGVLLVAWLAASGSALLSGHTPPRFSFVAPFRVAVDPADPGRGWGSPVGPLVLYWSITVALLLGTAFLAVVLQGLRAEAPTPLPGRPLNDEEFGRAVSTPSVSRRR